jgi:Holliday junction resolvase-like predicted endonuclease
VSAACHRLGVTSRLDASIRTPYQRAGDAAEDLVAEHLHAIGWQILARNVRVGREELDLVAVDPGPPPAIAVVEVRWRRNRDFGLPEETFDRRKRRHMWSGAMRVVALRELPGGVRLPVLPFRLDLIVVEPPPDAGSPPRMRHHRNVSIE